MMQGLASGPDFRSDFPFGHLAALLGDIQPRANTEPVVLSVGEPQHAPPPIIAETVAAHAHLWGRYPPTTGTAAFRDGVAGWLGRRYGLPPGMLEPERQILPLPGTREGLFMASLALVPDPGLVPDTAPGSAGHGRAVVLLPNPFYHVYAGGAIAARAEMVYMPAGRDTGFLPDLDALDPRVLDRAAVMFLCSPANPQGTIASLDYLTHALTLARRHNFVLLVDECYSEIYDTAPPPGALQAARAMGGTLDNLLVMNSLSKRSSAAGLRCGFACGDARAIEALRQVLARGTAGVSLPALAAATALYADEAHVAENRRRYRAKIDMAEAILGGRAGFYRPPGGFFLWLEVGDDAAVARRLWEEAAIRVLPGRFLGQPAPGNAESGNGSGAVPVSHPGVGFLRVALVYDEATTEAALRRMAAVL